MMTPVTPNHMKRRTHSPSQDEPLKENIKKRPNKKTGLVLSGGGAKAVFQAMVVSRFRDHGYEFDIISGVSSGSLNAAMVSQKIGGLVDLWLSVEKGDLFTGGVTPWRVLQMLVGWKESFYDNKGVKEFLKEHYDPSNTAIPFLGGWVNLQTAEFEEFEVGANGSVTHWRKEEIYHAIVASTSIPVLFSPVRHLGKDGDHLFVDGGLRNITPLSSMIKRDVDQIVIVTNSPRTLGTTAGDLSGPFDYAERSFDILLNEVLREDIDSILKINRIIEQCDSNVETQSGRSYRHIDMCLVEPRFGLGSLLDFSDDTQQKRIEEANNVCDRILK